MERVGTAVLKNRLSEFLNQVKKGASFIVTDRGVAVAKILPMDQVPAQSLEEKFTELERRGILTRPKNKSVFKKFEPISLPKGVKASEILIRMREEE